MITNLAYFYETSRKLRGGKWVWVKDSNGEQRGNVLLGGTILNPKKGFDHLYAAQLVQYTPAEGCLIFRSFKVQAATSAATDTEIFVEGDGYSDAPEVGMVVMKAPESLEVETLTVDEGVVTKTVAEYTGQSAKITAVVFDESNKKFKVTLDNALGALTTNDILVEATGTAKAADAKVLVKNPNTFIEADRDLMPTEGFGIKPETANYSISTVYNKQAWIARMQPLPKYVLAKNKSLIDGIFWI
jgi:hypothetical protein